MTYAAFWKPSRPLGVSPLKKSSSSSEKHKNEHPFLAAKACREAEILQVPACRIAAPSFCWHRPPGGLWLLTHPPSRSPPGLLCAEDEQLFGSTKLRELSHVHVRALQGSLAARALWDYLRKGLEKGKGTEIAAILQPYPKGNSA